MIVQGTEITVGVRVKDPVTGQYTHPNEIVLRIETPSGVKTEKRLTIGSVVQDPGDSTLYTATIDTSPEPGEWKYQFAIGGTVKKHRFRVRPLIGAYTPPPVGIPGTPPPPIANQGFALVFEDNFDSLDRNVWTNKIWFDPDPDPAWLADGFQQVTEGKLHQRSKRSFGSGYPQNAMTTLGAFAFQYGYAEARMQWTDGKGVRPGFRLYSVRHATNIEYPSVNSFCRNNGFPDEMCVAGQIDVFEGFGGPSYRPGWGPSNNFYFGTIHRNSAFPVYGVNDQINSNNWQGAGVDLTQDFHIYAIRWTPEEVIWYLDNVELMRSSAYLSLRQPMFLLLTLWNPNWMWPISPAPETPDTIENVWDYVRVWQQL